MAQHTSDASTGRASEPQPRRALPEEMPREAPGAGSPVQDPLGETESRPPRPPMERPPAPTSPALVRPPIVGKVVALYYLGLGAGAVGVTSALLWRSGVRDNLLAMMAESAADEARKQQVANLVQYGTVVLVAALLLVQLVLVARLAAGRRGTRPALVLVSAAQVLVYLVGADLVRGTGWEGLVVQGGLGIQALTAVVATLVSWAPPVGEWLGYRSAARRQQA